MLKHIFIICMLVLLMVFPSIPLAGEADVLQVIMSENMDGNFYLDVTVKHDDTGGEHFANWWRVTTEDGTELGRRVLGHPHFDQPFTRELDDLKVPEGVTVVIVEAHDNVHEYGGKTVRVDMTKERGEGYRVLKRKK